MAKAIQELIKQLEKIKDRSSSEARTIRKKLRAEGYSLRKKSDVKKDDESTKKSKKSKKVDEDSDDEDDDKDEDED